MAIQITNSQGTMVHIAALGTDVSSVSSIESAITGGDTIGCIQELGSISTSRNVNEYSCLSSDETSKSFGSLSLGNINLQLLFDADDAAGQAALRAMYTGNEEKVFIIELTDDGATNPSYFCFNGGISSEEVAIAKDSAVMYNVTVEITSVPEFTAAA